MARFEDLARFMEERCVEEAGAGVYLAPLRYQYNAWTNLKPLPHLDMSLYMWELWPRRKGTRLLDLRLIDEQPSAHVDPYHTIYVPGQFLLECCETRGRTARVKVTALYAAYQEYCFVHSLPTLEYKRFRKLMTDSFKVKRFSGGLHFIGVTLKENALCKLNSN